MSSEETRVTKEMYEAVFRGYDAVLRHEYPDVNAVEFDDELYDARTVTDAIDLVAHLRWMCRRCLEDFLPTLPASTDVQEKVDRWLGYVQGELRALGLFSVSELRAHNREGKVPLVRTDN